MDPHHNPTGGQLQRDLDILLFKQATSCWVILVLEWEENEVFGETLDICGVRPLSSIPKAVGYCFDEGLWH